VIAGRCNPHGKHKGHSKEISNLFLQHFGKVDRNKLQVILESLEYTRKVIRIEKLPSKRGRNYWILTCDGLPFDGAPTWNAERRDRQITESRKAGYRRKKKKKTEEDSDNWGKLVQL
jgi:hypothetical protein